MISSFNYITLHAIPFAGEAMPLTPVQLARSRPARSCKNSSTRIRYYHATFFFFLL